MEERAPATPLGEHESPLAPRRAYVSIICLHPPKPEGTVSPVLGENKNKNKEKDLVDSRESTGDSVCYLAVKTMYVSTLMQYF